MNGIRGAAARTQASCAQYRPDQAGQPHFELDASLPCPGDMVEYLYWAQFMAVDRELLQRLLQGFCHSDVPAQRTSLLRLAQDLHQIHRDFESAWMITAQFESRHADLDALQQQLDGAWTNTPEWNATAAAWGEKLLQLSDIEEACFDQRKVSGASMLGWTGQLIAARKSLIDDIRATLAAQPVPVQY